LTPTALNNARPEVPDLRFGGTWTLGQRIKNDALWLAAISTLTLLRPLPSSALRTLGRGLGACAHLFALRTRTIAMENVRLALPNLTARARAELVRRCFVTLGEFLGGTVSLLTRPPSAGELLPSEAARATIEEARAGGRGVLLASAHLGPWELVAASMVAAGIPLVAVTRESYDPRLSRLLAAMREQTGVRTIRRGRGAATGILRALRRGEVLGIPMDLRSRAAHCTVPFLGLPAETPSGPARIALAARSPVVVATAAPGADGTYVVNATAIDTADLRRDETSVRELSARINAELSRRILTLPHAWVWMHERWTLPFEAGKMVPSF
jgi:KDO2-lipid IV(A) lauroyltransferase